jgi:hypothetical protein
MARDTPPPGPTLISVLFSTFPLDASLAGTLHLAALDLYRKDQGAGPVAGDVVTGRVVNLKKSVALGAIAGPAFEAELDTARGSGKVRYLLTRQGLDLLGVEAPSRPAAPRGGKREYLN